MLSSARLSLRTLKAVTPAWTPALRVSAMRSLATRTPTDHSSPSHVTASFADLGLSEPLQKAMAEQNLQSPLPVQSAVIPLLLERKNIAFAASTGSGKTLSYLLPVLQNLALEESAGKYQRLPQRPRVLVLVPTRDLAVQILKEIKHLGHHSRVASCAVLGGEQYGPQRRSLSGTVDIVVASPGRLIKHKEQGNVFLSHVDTVIIDEVDTMFEHGFGSELTNILRTVLREKADEDKDLNRYFDRPQLVMATATMTPAVKRVLGQIEAGRLVDGDVTSPLTPTPIQILQVAGIHKPLPNVRHRFIDVKGRDKFEVMRSIVDELIRRKSRTLFFCNTIPSTRALDYALNDIPGAKVLSYHSSLNSREREENLNKFRSGECQFLVASDIAARGLDIPDVDHVFLFDFPLNPIDYLHRAGRCGRAGRKGVVTSLIAKRDLVLANSIELAIQKGLPIDSLTATKSDYLSHGKLANVFKRKYAEGEPRLSSKNKPAIPTIRALPRGKPVEFSRSDPKKTTRRVSKSTMTLKEARESIARRNKRFK